MEQRRSKSQKVQSSVLHCTACLNRRVAFGRYSGTSKSAAHLGTAWGYLQRHRAGRVADCRSAKQVIRPSRDAPSSTTTAGSFATARPLSTPPSPWNPPPSNTTAPYAAPPPPRAHPPPQATPSASPCRQRTRSAGRAGAGRVPAADAVAARR